MTLTVSSLPVAGSWDLQAHALPPGHSAPPPPHPQTCSNQPRPGWLQHNYVNTVNDILGSTSNLKKFDES